MDIEFEEVVHTYSRMIYQTAYLYVRNREAAEDITQEVLLKYYKKQSQFRGEASLKTYLTKLTFNCCYDHERSWKNKAHAWLEHFTFSGNQNVQKQVEGMAIQSELISAIHALKQPYREVIILYYFNEMKIREIAEILRCNENTVHTRLKRGREQLKGKLIEWEGDWHEGTIEAGN